MSREFVGFNPQELELRQAHAMLNACVAPRPIALTSTVSLSGCANLAPFSYFMAGGGSPLSIAISPGLNRHGEPKDTLRNLVETGEFVVNLVTPDMIDPMNRASTELPYGESEWELSGLTPAPSVYVAPARVLESPIALECRLFHLLPHGDGPGSANYVIGEVLYIHAAADTLVDGRPDSSRLQYLGRLDGEWYTVVDGRSRVRKARP